MENQKFELWCLVELFGHNRIAGKCTEQNVAGVNMLRVDVPETKKNQAFTKFFSSGAIYAINPISEELATELAENLEVCPVSVYEVRDLINREVLKLSSGDNAENEDY